MHQDVLSQGQKCKKHSFVSFIVTSTDNHNECSNVNDLLCPNLFFFAVGVVVRKNYFVLIITKHVQVPCGYFPYFHSA